LLQPELKAIKDGLTYVEDMACTPKIFYNPATCYYRGYVNARGQRQGVGIVKLSGKQWAIGEWNENLLHGVGMI
jgi:hypothetical protein